MVRWVGDACSLSDPVHGFHQQQRILVAPDRAFSQALAKTFLYMPCLVLIAPAGLFFHRNLSSGVHPSRVPFNTCSGLIETGGQPYSAQRTADLGFNGEVGFEAGEQLGQGTVLVTEGDSALLINARSGGCHLGDDLVGSSQYGNRYEHIVNTYVQQGSSAQVRVEQPVRDGWLRDESEVRKDAPNLAELSVFYHPHRFLIMGQEPAPEGFHQKHSRGSCRVYHFAGLPAVDGEGLFAKDRFSVGDAEQGVFMMLRVRACNVDHIHIRIVDQRFVTAIGMSESVRCRESRCLIEASGAHRPEICILQQFEIIRKFSGDTSAG